MEKSAKTIGSLVHKNRYFRRRNDCTRLNDRPGKGNFIFSRVTFFLFLLSFVFPYPATLFRGLYPLPLLFHAFLFTAANNSFCDVISLRLCSFVDTTVLYSIPGDSYRSYFPCMPATFPFFAQSFPPHPSSSPAVSPSAYIFRYHPRQPIPFLGTKTEMVSVARFNRYSAVPLEIERFVV